MLETLDYTIRIGSAPTILYFDLYLYSAYAAHYVYDIFHHLTTTWSTKWSLCLNIKGILDCNEPEVTA